MKTVLLIDDDIVVHIVVKRTIGSRYRVICSDTGEEGFNRAVSEKPDMILLDIRLPGEDGIKIHDRLKETTETADIPVIYVTSEEDASTEQICRQKGALDYIRKPFAPRQLLESVQAVLPSDSSDASRVTE